ncbi:hypothetical protein [Nesterenkonia rhizosphaerae]|uniref:Nuclear transport factor 2 family protein n=1 Tax=Nesterenkonia rhizosphaerae TaxID=1348272 RepID=A0ABP9G181_9MICC
MRKHLALTTVAVTALLLSSCAHPETAQYQAAGADPVAVPTATDTTAPALSETEQFRLDAVQQLVSATLRSGSASEAERSIEHLFTEDLRNQRQQRWNVGEYGLDLALASEGFDAANVEVADDHAVLLTWSGTAACGVQEDHSAVVFIETVEVDGELQLSRLDHSVTCSCATCMA